MVATTPELLTVTEIARRLDVAPHVITYVVRTREIQPARWAGHARLFDKPAVRRIAGELARMANDRDAPHFEVSASEETTQYSPSPEGRTTCRR